MPAPKPYPDLLIRGAAFAVDAFLVLTAYAFTARFAWALEQAHLGYWAIGAIAALYFTIFPATPMQASPGKRMGKMRIADTAGRPIGLVRSFLRFAASVPSIAFAGAGFLLAAWTPRRQALHDLAAGTLVVHRDATAEQAARPAPPYSWLGRLGLALTLAFVVLVGQTFVQVYQDRETRNRVVRAISHTNAYRDAVRKALAERLPAPAAPAPHEGLRAVITRPDGAIVLELAHELAPGGRVVFRPSREAQRNGEYWTCSAENIHPKLLPAGCRP